MRVQITARHCDVPEDILERTEELISALSKYDRGATSADVVYTEEKNSRHVEVIVHVDGAEPVIASGDSAEFRTALDQVVDRLGRMLRKRRSRRREHQAPPLADGIVTE